MKRILTAVVLSTSLAAGPAFAERHGEGLLNKENVGGAIGATVGGFVGSQFGDGDGQLATTAIGAVGGYVLGRDIAHNYGGRRHYSKKRHRYRDYDKPRYRTHDRRKSYKRRIRPIHETYVARTTSNVRSGPGTRFRVVDRVHDRERVRVIGKVRHRNWYMVRTGHRRGFVYAPLLRPARYGHRWDRDRYDRHDRDDRRNRWRH